MKVAIIGASGKTGTCLVRGALNRGYQVVAVCRDTSVGKMEALGGRNGLTVVPTPVVSDQATLTRALAGCDAVAAILISVRRLKATELVASLTAATATNGVKRLVFTAGEVTTVPEKDEVFTMRQRLLLALVPPVLRFTPFSMKDMIAASEMVRQQVDWQWTIVRAPSLRQKDPTGYRFCDISEVTTAHVLSRQDYAACLLDSLGNPDHHRRILTVVGADG